MNTPTIAEIFDNRSQQLQTSLGMPCAHPTTKGDVSEVRWKEFLESFLPNRYAVSKGFVFDSKGGVSEQIDLIIYDPFHSPLILDEGNGEKCITAESVYAVFEVKPNANKSHVEYADEKISSVKKLHRTQRGMIASGKQLPPRELTPIIGGLLTLGSISPNTLKGYIEVSDNVDLVCAASVATFHKRQTEVSVSSPDEAVFSFFYLLLDELFKLGTIGAIDIRDYADQSLSSFTLERGEF